MDRGHDQVRHATGALLPRAPRREHVPALDRRSTTWAACPRQAYYDGIHEIDDDEALILETDAAARSAATGRRWWPTTASARVDWVNRQSSLNDAQAHIDSDGKFRAVISQRDPGVPNWLDKGDYPWGVIQMRWNRASDYPDPTIKKVLVADVRDHLPADTPVVTPERAAGAAPRPPRRGAAAADLVGPFEMGSDTDDVRCSRRPSLLSTACSTPSFSSRRVTTRFEMINEPSRFGRVFGGQLIAQGLLAAAATVEGKPPHSLHAYFVAGGASDIPLVASVERVRDGRSMAARRVSITQDGQPLLALIASFHASPVEPQSADPPPAVAAPDELPSLQDWVRRSAPEIRPGAESNWIVNPPPVQVRMGEALRFLGGQAAPGTRSHWMRVPRAVGDDPLLHTALLAYASDFFLLDMAFRGPPVRPARVVVHLDQPRSRALVSPSRALRRVAPAHPGGGGDFRRPGTRAGRPARRPRPSRGHRDAGGARPCPTVS